MVQMKGPDGDDERVALGGGAARRASEDGGEESSMTAAMVERARFIAFKTKEMAPAYAMPLLKHNRLVVVLDLDETLVQATTLHALDKRVEKMRGRMVSLMKFDHTNPRASAVMVEEVKKERMACEVALRRLQTDRAMLAQYCVEGAVTLNNRRSVTIPEIESLPNGTQRLKNVIRLPSPHIKGGMMVFTVVNPADPGTAMLVHATGMGRVAQVSVRAGSAVETRRGVRVHDGEYRVRSRDVPNIGSTRHRIRSRAARTQGEIRRAERVEIVVDDVRRALPH